MMRPLEEAGPPQARCINSRYVYGSLALRVGVPRRRCPPRIYFNSPPHPGKGGNSTGCLPCRSPFPPPGWTTHPAPQSDRFGRMGACGRCPRRPLLGRGRTC
eukprot:601063-Prorocentrum_minimum.AAC.1